MLRTYVLFHVDLRSGDVMQINLLLYSRTGSRSAIRCGSSTSASGSAASRSPNAPQLSTHFVTSGPLRANAWKQSTSRPVDDSQRYVGFALTTASPKGVEFASRETGLHGPRLIVEREDTDTTTGTTTTDLLEPEPG